MEHLLTLLQLLQPMSPGLQTALTQQLRRDALSRKHWLLQPGQVSERLYFIEQGVDAVRDVPKHRRIPVELRLR